MLLVPLNARLPSSGQLPAPSALQAGWVSEHPGVRVSPPGSLLWLHDKARVGADTADPRPLGWKSWKNEVTTV